MLSFLKKYWAYLITMVGGSYLAINYFLEEKRWLAFIWLTVAMVWSVRLYQHYQRDQKHKK